MRKRARHAGELVPKIRSALLAHTALEREEMFVEAVPCSAVRPIEQMFDRPQVKAERIIASMSLPTLGSYRGVTRSIKFSRTPGPDPFAPPQLSHRLD